MVHYCQSQGLVGSLLQQDGTVRSTIFQGRIQGFNEVF
jgi:hypothetical protein